MEGKGEAGDITVKGRAERKLKKIDAFFGGKGRSCDVILLSNSPDNYQVPYITEVGAETALCVPPPGVDSVGS